MSKAFEEIVDLNEDSVNVETSSEWEQEILARIRAVDKDKVDGVSFESVLREAEGRLLTSIPATP